MERKQAWCRYGRERKAKERKEKGRRRGGEGKEKREAER